MEKAMRRAREHKYAPIVYRKMVANHMPPQFLYLALQESSFKHDAVGPKTRFGIAKGIWQFIPDTAVQYGLTTGPLVELPLYDPRDERFDFEKATDAAAQYIRFIYTTEAQASGLLVMASYNWGDTKVRGLIRKMPESPRERNFWKLLKTNKIPDQTHDYVFYIFSAAVIGENPKLFGFEFENPLENLDES
jgi:membrane-bound lytic murein transglycosylase D